MDNIKKHIVFKIICTVLVITFIALDVSWAHPDPFATQHQTLANESNFQPQMMHQLRQKLYVSKLDGMKLALATRNIGNYLLAGTDLDARSELLEHLHTVMANEFRRYGLDEMAELIDLDGVQYLHDGKLVKIPCKDNQDIYIAKRSDLTSRELAGYDWEINDGENEYAVCVMARDHEVKPVGHKLGQKDTDKSGQRSVTDEIRDSEGNALAVIVRADESKATTEDAAIQLEVVDLNAGDKVTEDGKKQLVYYVEKGEVSFEKGGFQKDLKEGDLIVALPGTASLLESISGATRITVIREAKHSTAIYNPEDKVDSGGKFTVIEDSGGRQVAIYISTKDVEDKFTILSHPSFPLGVMLKVAPADKAGKGEKLHIETSEEGITQAELVILAEGKAELTVSREDGSQMQTVNLSAGDKAINFAGHTFAYTGNVNRAIIIRQGPYPGVKSAKRIIEYDGDKDTHLYPGRVERAEFPEEEFPGVRHIESLTPNASFKAVVTGDEIDFRYEADTKTTLSVEEEDMIKNSLREWLGTLARRPSEIPILVSYDMDEIGEHRANRIEINRTLLRGPPEQTKDLQLFLHGVVFHEGMHFTHPAWSESTVKDATASYFATRSDVSNATLRVLIPENRNLINAVDPEFMSDLKNRVIHSNHITRSIKQRIDNQLKLMTEELGEDITTEPYSEIAKHMKLVLATIALHLNSGEINPDISIRTSQDDPEMTPTSDTMRVGVFPVAADPLNWAYLINALNAMAKFELDKIVFIVAAEDLRKPNMTPAEVRHPMAKETLEIFAPLFEYSSIALGTDYDGETNIFRILELNPDQRIDAFYLVGAGHYYRINPKHQPDTIQKLEDNIGGKIYGFNSLMHSVSAVFFEREFIDYRIETTLDVDFIQGVNFEASSTDTREGKFSVTPWTSYRHAKRCGLYGLEGDEAELFPGSAERHKGFIAHELGQGKIISSFIFALLLVPMAFGDTGTEVNRFRYLAYGILIGFTAILVNRVLLAMYKHFSRRRVEKIVNAPEQPAQTSESETADVPDDSMPTAPSPIKRIGILTGGGPASGHNALIYAAYLEAKKMGAELIGICNGFDGLINEQLVNEARPLTFEEVDRVKDYGGTIIGADRVNPYSEKNLEKGIPKIVWKNIQKLKLDALITAGGDDTNGAGAKLSKEHGNFPVIGVSKTIDNDLALPDNAPSYGYDTWVTYAREQARGIEENARALKRVMVTETFGRNAGFDALGVGMSIGAARTLIPEVEVDFEELVRDVELFYRRFGYAVVIVSEGINIALSFGKNKEMLDKAFKNDKIAKAYFTSVKKYDDFGHPKLEGAGRIVAAVLDAHLSCNVTETEKITYAARTASPTFSDFERCILLGAGAVKQLFDGKYGNLLYIDRGTARTIPLEGQLGGRTVDVSDYYGTHYMHANVAILLRDKSDIFTKSPTSSAEGIERRAFLFTSILAGLTMSRKAKAEDAKNLFNFTKPLLYETSLPYLGLFQDNALTGDFEGFTRSYQGQAHEGRTSDIGEYGASSYDLANLGRIQLDNNNTKILDTFVNYWEQGDGINNPIFFFADNYTDGAGNPIKGLPFTIIRILGRDVPGWWNTWDWNVDIGAAAELITLALDAYERTSESKYRDFASGLGDALLKMQDTDGGFRFAPIGVWHESGNEFYWNLKSTEKNMRLLTSLENLYDVTGESRFEQSTSSVTGWLKSMYNRQEHLFHTAAQFNGLEWVRSELGTGSEYFATDTTALAPLELMYSDTFFGQTQGDRNIEIRTMFEATNARTAFLDSQGLPIFYRFSGIQTGDYGTAEWTSQMALCYLRIAQLYASSGRGMPAIEATNYYLERYNTLTNSLRNTFYDRASTHSSTLVSPYASYLDGAIAGGVPTGTGYDTEYYEAALASVWIGFALSGFNPAKLDGGLGIPEQTAQVPLMNKLSFITFIVSIPVIFKIFLMKRLEGSDKILPMLLFGLLFSPMAFGDTGTEVNRFRYLAYGILIGFTAILVNRVLLAMYKHFSRRRVEKIVNAPEQPAQTSESETADVSLPPGRPEEGINTAASEEAQAPESQEIKEVEEYINNRRTKFVKGLNTLIKILSQDKELSLDFCSTPVDRKNMTTHLLDRFNDILAITKSLADEKIPVETRALLTDLSELRDQIEADSVIASYIILARRAKRMDQKLIIPFSTDWIPGFDDEKSLQKNAKLDKLIDRIESLPEELRKMGLNNVETVRREKDESLDAWLERIKGVMTDPSDFSFVVFLDSINTINAIRSEKLQSIDQKKAPFYAAINPEEFDKYYGKHDIALMNYQIYIQVLEMLSIALELATGKEAPETFDVRYCGIDVTYDRDIKMVIFLPYARKINYEELPARYKSRLEALTKA